MPYEFKLQRRVEFSETDMAGIVHFANFFRYMESVEHAFYRSLGFSAMLGHLDPPMGFPRVHAECDYRAPLRFEETVELHLLVREKRLKVLSYLVRMRNLSAAPVVEVARGALVVVCVAQQADGSMAAAPMPGHVFDQIQVAPAHLLE